MVQRWCRWIHPLYPKRKNTKVSPTKKFLLANLIIALGGRAAEVILYETIRAPTPSSYADDYVFNNIDNLDITTGASGDLKQANSIARQYVAQLILDEMVGLYDLSAGSKPFLGRDMAMGGDKMSDETKKIIDKKVAELVEFAYSSYHQIISKNKQRTLNAIASNLIENVTISGAGFG